jgi:hypothetical protein
MIHELAGIKSGDKVIFVCPSCRRPPEAAYGAQNKDQLVYVWICWRCGGRTLAEWLTTGDREKELRDFAQRVKILA